ncbi:MAG: ATP-binding cassette domain-containing protein [Rhizobiales bacterium]|nr:ATP-binding cassette domain-containing protein [Hyphomicrobiales bacterium]
MREILSVSQLSIDYPLKRESLFSPRRSLRAVDDVSFSIVRGRALGLVGESGSGKSSVARAVMGLQRPSSGTLNILGRDIFAMPPRELLGFRAHFQMIFQDPYGSLDPRHTVGRIVAEPARRSAAEMRNEVAAALEAVGLNPQDSSRYPHQFSGGQRQRIAIARALVTRPALLVADEPVSALDVSVQAQVLNLLRKLRETLGLTYLFISHDLAVVRYICDDICVMFAGQIVEHGDVGTVLNAPAHPYTIALRDAMPRLDRHGPRRRRSTSPEEARADAEPGGCPYASRCTLAVPKCIRERPELRPLPDGRSVACHNVQ